ncbi:PqqD family protein [Emticicia fontis]
MNYTINTEKILFTQLGEEGVLCDIDTNEYISLNETLFKILKGIEEGDNVETIVSNLCKEYNISEEACKADVDEAISKLAAKKYII